MSNIPKKLLLKETWRCWVINKLYTMKIRKIDLYNLFYIFIYLVWVPIRRYYLHIDGTDRTLLILTIVALLVNASSISKDKKLFASPAFICWALLVLFSFINSICHGINSRDGVLIFIQKNFLCPFVFLISVLLELHNNKYLCLKTILYAQLLFLFIGITHLSVSEDRVVADLLGNGLPLMGSGCMLVAGILYCEKKLRGKGAVFVLIVFFCTLIIVLSATRKAFGAIVIILIGVLLGRVEKLKPGYVFFLIVVAFMAYHALDWIVGNTFLGERITTSSDRFDVPLSSNPVINNFLMILLGDRAIQYFIGTEIFHQHRLFGIGLLNYPSVSQTDYRLHSEYMVQLCENGIIGFSLLLIFYLILFKGIKKIWKKRGVKVFIYLSGLLAILFLNLTAWTYDMSIAMIIYAIIINEIYSSIEQNENSDSSPQGQLQ